MRQPGPAGLVRAIRGLFLVLLATLLACKPSATADDKKFDVDADPAALLPPGAILVSWADAQALFASAQWGPRLGALADRFVPLAEDAELVPSRDILQVVSAAYATGDGVTILHGRFNASRIEGTQTTRRGASVTHGSYAGRVTSMVGQVSFAVLSAHTAVAATGDGLRQALDRVAALEAGGKVAPALPPWMVESVANRTVDPHPAIAVVADLATQPIAAATLATLKPAAGQWLDGLQRGKVLVTVVGDPEPSGLHVSATLSYADPARAEEAAKGARSAGRWLRVLGLLGGGRLDFSEVTAQADDLRCSLTVDDRMLLALLSRLAP